LIPERQQLKLALGNLGSRWISRCEKKRRPGFKSVQYDLLDPCRYRVMFSISRCFGQLWNIS